MAAASDHKGGSLVADTILNPDYTPVQQGMPQNCSADLSRIADHVDTIIGSKNTTAIQELQSMFALQELEHTDDFAECVYAPSPNLPLHILMIYLLTYAEPCQSHCPYGRAPISIRDTAYFSRCVTPFKVFGKST